METTEYPTLFSPTRIGTLELANRLVVPPVATNQANSDGTVSDAIVAYRVAVALERAGVDSIGVSAGVYETVNYVVAPTTLPPGYLLPLAAEIKRSVSVPVMGLGRITDPGMAERALESGIADLIAFGLQSIADPEFPKKVASGRTAEVDRCTACLEGCIGHFLVGQVVTCTTHPPHTKAVPVA